MWIKVIKLQMRSNPNQTSPPQGHYPSVLPCFSFFPAFWFNMHDNCVNTDALIIIIIQSKYRVIFMDNINGTNESELHECDMQEKPKTRILSSDMDLFSSSP